MKVESYKELLSAMLPLAQALSQDTPPGGPWRGLELVLRMGEGSWEVQWCKAASQPRLTWPWPVAGSQANSARHAA